MSSSAPPLPKPVSAEAILAGAADQLAYLLGHPVADGTADAPSAQAGLLAAAGVERELGAFADRFWALYRQHSGLHEAVLARLDALRPAIAGAALAGAFTNVADPLWGWLDTLQRGFIGYQPGLGRGGERLLAELESAVAQVADTGWTAGLAGFSAQWQQERGRLERLEQRLDAAERGQLRARQAQQRAARLLNRCMGGRRLPAEIVAFLQGDWYRELQWCLLQHGEQGPEWQRRAQLTEQLIASLQPVGDDATARQLLYDLIPVVGPALRALLAERAHDPALLEQQLALIEKQHLLLLRGQLPAAADFALIANGESWLDSAALSSDLLAQVERLAPGDWFLGEGEAGGESRIRLALKMDDCAQLLFVNRLGVKAGQCSFEAFAYRLAVAEVNVLPPPGIALDLLRQLLQQSIQQLELRERQRATAQALAAARAAAEQRSRDQTRAKALAEAAALAQAESRRAVERAEAEAARAYVAQEEAELARAGERERRQRLQEGSGEQRLRRARQALSLLAVGDWLELHDELGASQRLKVAVKLPSSGKLILVDREGIKRAELGFDELAANLADGGARVLSRGPQFEDTLAKVVDGLRRDRGQG
jgi:hypothetical protein